MSRPIRHGYAKKPDHPHAGYLRDRIAVLTAYARPAHPLGHVNVNPPNHSTPPPPHERFYDPTGYNDVVRVMMGHTQRGRI